MIQRPAGAFRLTARVLTFIVAATLGSTAAQGESLLLKGAIVHPVAGDVLSPGEVLVEGGKIVSLGKAVSAPGANVVDISGLHLYPGLIALNTVLGLAEISGVRATLDLAEVGEFTPDVESWIAVNPDSEVIPVSRANGIAFFEATPQGGIIAGQSGLVSVEGWSTEQRTLKKHVALHVYWPKMELTSPDPYRERSAKEPAKSKEEQAKERRAKVQSLTDFFEEAQAYAKAKTATERGSFRTIPAWEAMVPYVEGKLPIMAHADEIRQIRSAIEWSRKSGVRIILAGGRDAWMAAEQLASNSIPVVYEHMFSQPARDTEAYDVHYRTPALLAKCGVRVALSIGSDAFNITQIRNLPYSAAQAVAFGWTEEEALKSVTLYPAELAGVAGQLGSIEPGKLACLIACDRPIFDLRGNVKRMWMNGKEISLESRHTRLYERYRNRPK